MDDWAQFSSWTTNTVACYSLLRSQWCRWKILEKGVTPKEEAEPQLLRPSCFFSKRNPLTRGMEHLQLHMD